MRRSRRFAKGWIDSSLPLPYVAPRADRSAARTESLISTIAGSTGCVSCSPMIQPMDQTTEDVAAAADGFASTGSDTSSFFTDDTGVYFLVPRHAASGSGAGTGLRAWVHSAQGGCRQLAERRSTFRCMPHVEGQNNWGDVQASTLSFR